MFCTNCGTRNEDAAAFCGNCGAKLTFQQSVAPAQSVYQVQSWPAAPQQPLQKEKLPGKGLGIASLVLSLLALVLVSIWEAATVAALLGMALSCLAMAKATKVGRRNNLAVAGMICGAVALAMVVIFVVIRLAAIPAMPDAGLDYSVYL